MALDLQNLLGISSGVRPASRAASIESFASLVECPPHCWRGYRQGCAEIKSQRRGWPGGQREPMSNVCYPLGSQSWVLGGVRPSKHAAANCASMILAMVLDRTGAGPDRRDRRQRQVDGLPDWSWGLGAHIEPSTVTDLASHDGIRRSAQLWPSSVKPFMPGWRIVAEPFAGAADRLPLGASFIGLGAAPRRIRSSFHVGAAASIAGWPSSSSRACSFPAASCSGVRVCLSRFDPRVSACLRLDPVGLMPSQRSERSASRRAAFLGILAGASFAFGPAAGSSFCSIRLALFSLR